MDLQRVYRSIQDFCRDIARNLGASSLRPKQPKLASVGSSSIVSSTEIEELELLSESLHIDKETIRDGELSIRKEVITETQVIHVPVKREEIVIERRSTDGKSVEVLHGRNQLRIPVSKERVVVRKEPVVSEIVKIRRQTIGETKRVSEFINHEELRIHPEGNVHIAGDEGDADKVA